MQYFDFTDLKPSLMYLFDSLRNVNFIQKLEHIKSTLFIHIFKLGTKIKTSKRKRVLLPFLTPNNKPLLAGYLQVIDKLKKEREKITRKIVGFQR